jgi:hypothetical protein
MYFSTYFKILYAHFSPSNYLISKIFDFNTALNILKIIHINEFILS